VIQITDALSSLRVRILGGVFFIFFLAMGMVLYGVWSFQRDKLVEMTGRQAIQLSDVIVAGLRSSMLQNDRTESMRSITSILQVADTSRISVLNGNGRVIMTSDADLKGRVLDKMTHPSCRNCHAAGGKRDRTSAFTGEDGEKYIATVTAIRNEPACYGCHDREQAVIGVLLMESSFRSTTIMLDELARRIVLTGIFAFLAGALLLHSIVTRFFTRPLDALLHGFEKVGRGDFFHWVDVKSGGEIGYMADSFNVMSRAIGRFVDEIKEKTQEVSAHYTIVGSLSETIEKKKLKEVVVDLLKSLLEAECVSMALAVEQHSHIFEMVKIQKGDKRYYHGYYDTESGEPRLCALTREDILEWRQGGSISPFFSPEGSKLLLPLEHKNMSVGLIGVVKPAGAVFTLSEKKIIPVLTHHISISLANARLYDMAITDGLTTLYTKRYFLKKIDDYIENFHTTRRGFCLLMMDIDHFKQVNDEYGHPAGDRILMHIAGLIRSNIRHGDLAFRYGGEEFAALLKGDSIEEALRIAERVRLAVKETGVEIAGTAPVAKTLSIGIACFPHHFATSGEIIAAADAALYEAKQKGRNQTAVYCRK
jgi:diguanylate cyclase (GGDEF)-like protein